MVQRSALAADPTSHFAGLLRASTEEVATMRPPPQPGVHASRWPALLPGFI